MHESICLKIKDIEHKKRCHLNLYALFRVSSRFFATRKTLPGVKIELHQNAVKM